ncbi:hypothetical protein ACH5RR_009096 [Cinchona calisaya]|uniref:Uncharacterized protein n=1 Tax=Cinchona calisaya TaxID=153742 RepID=A0ABD3AF03_9GENT
MELNEGVRGKEKDRLAYGYYDCLLGLFDKGVEEGFIRNSARDNVISAQTAGQLIEEMEDYVPLHNKVAPRRSWNVKTLNLQRHRCSYVLPKDKNGTALFNDFLLEHYCKECIQEKKCDFSK